VLGWRRNAARWGRLAKGGSVTNFAPSAMARMQLQAPCPQLERRMGSGSLRTKPIGQGVRVCVCVCVVGGGCLCAAAAQALWPPSPTLNAGHHARRSTLATALNTRRLPPPPTVDAGHRPRRSTLATVPGARRWPPSPTLDAGRRPRRSTLGTMLVARRWPPPSTLDAGHHAHRSLQRCNAPARLQVHSGMLRAAQWVHASLWEGDAMAAALLAAPEGSTLLCCGHSLGGGVAALVAMLLRHDLRLTLGARETLRAVVLAPAAAVDLELSLRVRDFVASVVLGSDIIPRVDVYSITEFVHAVARVSPFNRFSRRLKALLRRKRKKAVKAAEEEAVKNGRVMMEVAGTVARVLDPGMGEVEPAQPLGSLELDISNAGASKGQTSARGIAEGTEVGACSADACNAPAGSNTAPDHSATKPDRCCGSSTCLQAGAAVVRSNNAVAADGKDATAGSTAPAAADGKDAAAGSAAPADAECENAAACSTAHADADGEHAAAGSAAPAAADSEDVAAGSAALADTDRKCGAAGCAAPAAAERGEAAACSIAHADAEREDAAACSTAPADAEGKGAAAGSTSAAAADGAAGTTTPAAAGGEEDDQVGDLFQARSAWRAPEDAEVAANRKRFVRSGRIQMPFGPGRQLPGQHQPFSRMYPPGTLFWTIPEKTSKRGGGGVRLSVTNEPEPDAPFARLGGGATGGMLGQIEHHRAADHDEQERARASALRRWLPCVTSSPKEQPNKGGAACCISASAAADGDGNGNGDARQLKPALAMSKKKEPPHALREVRPETFNTMLFFTSALVGVACRHMRPSMHPFVTLSLGSTSAMQNMN